MEKQERAAIVLVPFGTLHAPALATYEGIVRAYEKEFPGFSVWLAFSSSLMRKRLEKKEGIFMPGLLGALEEAQDQGCERVAVQSLQIVPGKEFHQTAGLVWALGQSRCSGFSHLELGLPLLSTISDCRTVSSLLPALVRQAGGYDCPAENEGQKSREAVLLAGHGTGHPADALYALLARIMRSEHGNIFLGSIEGSLGLEDLLPKLRASGAEEVLLHPFLLVAGGHAEKDLFGSHPRSWKSILVREGYAVRACRRGLGEHPEIVSIFMEHTRSALKMMKKQ